MFLLPIDAQVNDYEEDNAQYGKQSIGKITARLKARDIGLEDLSKYTKGSKFWQPYLINTIEMRFFQAILLMTVPHLFQRILQKSLHWL